MITARLPLERRARGAEFLDQGSRLGLGLQRHRRSPPFIPPRQKRTRTDTRVQPTGAKGQDMRADEGGRASSSSAMVVLGPAFRSRRPFTYVSTNALELSYPRAAPGPVDSTNEAFMKYH